MREGGGLVVVVLLHASTSSQLCTQPWTYLGEESRWRSRADKRKLTGVLLFLEDEASAVRHPDDLGVGGEGSTVEGAASDHDGPAAVGWREEGKAGHKT